MPVRRLPIDQFGGDAAAPGNEGLADPMQLAKGRFNRDVHPPHARSSSASSSATRARATATSASR